MIRTAGVLVVLVVSVARGAMGELEEARSFGLPRVEATSVLTRSPLSPDRVGVNRVALDPEIAQKIARYRALAPQLESSAVGLPILVKSQQESWSFRGDVYTIVRQPFEVVRDELGNPGGWCEVLPLHFNVKACTYAPSGDRDSLTLYLGRKFYQPIFRAESGTVCALLPRAHPG